MHWVAGRAEAGSPAGITPGNWLCWCNRVVLGNDLALKTIQRLGLKVSRDSTRSVSNRWRKGGLCWAIAESAQPSEGGRAAGCQHGAGQRILSPGTS